jgi:hypothetical protein
MKILFNRPLLLVYGVVIGIVISLIVPSFFRAPDIWSIFTGSPFPLAIPRNIYVPEVEKMQALARLTTTRFNFSRIVTGQQDMPTVLSALYGDGLVMVAVGHIDAGISVDQMTQDDIVYSEDPPTLTVTLPDPTLQNCFLDEQQSYVVSRQTGIFASPMRNLESATRLYALRQYRDQALEDGILDQARTEIRNVMENFLEIVVGEDVTIAIQFDEAIADAPFTESCR